MRLDDYLLKHGVKCRETANYLIKNRLVTVNGRAVTYGALPLEDGDSVEINEKNKDAPASFWKLKEIQESINLIQRGDFVLDVESPDGGFPLFAARSGANVTLVTIKDMDFLKCENVEIKKNNVVIENPEKVLSSKFDIIIMELGFDVMKTIQLLEKLRSFLGSRGRLLVFLPEKGRENAREMAEEMLLRQNLEVLNFFDSGKGFYVCARAF